MSFFTSSEVYLREAFSMPSVVIMNTVCSGTSSSLMYLCTSETWWMAPPIASISAVQPRTQYCLSVMGSIFSKGMRSWMTSVRSSKRIVETSASPSSFFCFSIMALKPPMVSLSSPPMEPERSRMNTISVKFFFIVLYLLNGIGLLLSPL